MARFKFPSNSRKNKRGKVRQMRRIRKRVKDENKLKIREIDRTNEYPFVLFTTRKITSGWDMLDVVELKQYIETMFSGKFKIKYQTDSRSYPKPVATLKEIHIEDEDDLMILLLCKAELFSVLFKYQV